MKVAECRLLCKQSALLSGGAHTSKLSPRPGAPHRNESGGDGR